MKTKELMAAVCAAAFVAAAVAAPFADGDRVSFYGDSITHGGTWHRNIILYYLTRFPDRAISFTNSGCGGDNADHSRRTRLDDIVIARKPNIVVVMFGMNDFGFPDYGATVTSEQIALQRRRLDDYRTNMDLLVSAIEKGLPGVRICLMTPTPFDDTAIYPEGEVNEHPGANGGLTAAAQIVAELADRRGLALVDQNSTVNAYIRAQRRKNDGVTFAADRIHPGGDVHLLMSICFLDAQNAPRVVSDVKLQAGRVLGARNADVSDLAWSDGRVSFTLLEKSLPWPMVEDARRCGDGALLPALVDYNRETLALYGLADGEWTLRIDGVEVITATARQWEIGVDLGGNEKTPQYRHALDVARENHRAHERMGQIQATNTSLIRFISELMRNENLDPKDAAVREDFIRRRIPKLNPWDVPAWTNIIKEWDDTDRLVLAVDEFWPKLRGLAITRPHRYELVRRADGAGQRAAVGE